MTFKKGITASQNEVHSLHLDDLYIMTHKAFKLSLGLEKLELCMQVFMCTQKHDCVMHVVYAVILHMLKLCLFMCVHYVYIMSTL